jgi:hypothetical protein
MILKLYFTHIFPDINGIKRYDRFIPFKKSFAPLAMGLNLLLLSILKNKNKSNAL